VIDPRFVSEGEVFETVEGRSPSGKAVSMRLARECRQGLVERKRQGHKFLCKVTQVDGGRASLESSMLILSFKTFRVHHARLPMLRVRLTSA
jgi:hypothetical protein